MDQHNRTKIDTLQTLLLCESEYLGMGEEQTCLLREAIISLTHIPNYRMWQVANNSMFVCEGRDEWEPVVGRDGVHSILKTVDATEWKQVFMPYYLTGFIAIQLPGMCNIMICGELISSDQYNRLHFMIPRSPSTQNDKHRCCFIFNTTTRATTRCLNTPFAFAQSAGLVLEDGSVFVCGGRVVDKKEMNEDRAALWIDERWHLLPARMRYRRRNHMCALLDDGRVLVFGGQDTPDSRTCEIFDPCTGRFSRAADLPFYTWLSAAVITLPDGRIMACGGYHQNMKSRRGKMTLIYDPAEDAWTEMAPMKIERLREHSLILGADEMTVIVVGGENKPYPALYYLVEVYDISKNEWSLDPTRRIYKNAEIVKYITHTNTYTSTHQRYNMFFNGFC